MVKITHLRLIASGQTIEVFNYQEKGIIYDFKVPKQQTKKTRIIVVDEETRLKKIASRQASMQRARTNLRRIVNTNAWNWNKPSNKPYIPIFATFTFADEIRDIPTANKVFSDFIRRLNYHIANDKKSFLKYVVVIEFQDKKRKGVIHYHTTFFNLPFIWKDTLTEIWDNGMVDIKKINHVTNVGAYMSKYMGKNFEDSRLDGKKRYFTSRGLLKQTEIKNEKNVLAIINRIPKDFISDEREFTTKYKGKVKYRQYNLGKKKSLIDVIPDLKNFL